MKAYYQAPSPPVSSRKKYANTYYDEVENSDASIPNRLRIAEGEHAIAPE